MKQAFIGGWKPQPRFHEEDVHDHVKSVCSSLVGEPLKLVGIDGALIKEIHVALEVLRLEVLRERVGWIHCPRGSDFRSSLTSGLSSESLYADPTIRSLSHVQAARGPGSV